MQVSQLKIPARDAPISTSTAHGRTTANSAPPKDSLFPAEALSPVAASRRAQIVNRSRDMATVYRNFGLLTGSINAAGLNASGLARLKSSGLFRHITTVASACLRMPGSPA